MYRTDNKDIWRVFREHHYLSAEINKACTFYTIYWEDTLVAMFSCLNQPSGSYKYAFRIHRTVVLPDYQGLGIGTKILDYFGKMYTDNGNKLFLRTTHTRFATHCRNSIKWIEGNSSGKVSNAGGKTHEKKYKNYDRKRTPFSFEYMGEGYATKPHISIHIDYNNCMNLELIKNDLQYLLNKGYYLTVITGEPKSTNPIEYICQELGIRTQMLYYHECVIGKYKDKKILTSWTQEFSDKVRRRY